MTRLARDHAPDSAVHGDSRYLPFAPGSFEGVRANLSLLHLPKSQVAGAVAEVARVLCQGGIFFAGLQAGSDDAIEVSASMSAPRFYARYNLDWTGRLTEAGFDVIEAETSGFALRTFARKP